MKYIKTCLGVFLLMLAFHGTGPIVLAHEVETVVAVIQVGHPFRTIHTEMPSVKSGDCVIIDGRKFIKYRNVAVCHIYFDYYHKFFIVRILFANRASTEFKYRDWRDSKIVHAPVPFHDQYASVKWRPTTVYCVIQRGDMLRLTSESITVMANVSQTRVNNIWPRTAKDDACLLGGEL